MSSVSVVIKAPRMDELSQRKFRKRKEAGAEESWGKSLCKRQEGAGSCGMHL